MTVQEEFENYMMFAFPKVSRSSTQWGIMELTWHSATFLTAQEAILNTKNPIVQWSEESNRYIKERIEKMVEAEEMMAP